MVTSKNVSDPIVYIHTHTQSFGWLTWFNMMETMETMKTKKNSTYFRIQTELIWIFIYLYIWWSHFKLRDLIVFEEQRHVLRQ